MKNLKSNIKKADNLALLVLALAGFLLNDLMGFTFDATALQMISDLVINLLY